MTPNLTHAPFYFVFFKSTHMFTGKLLQFYLFNGLEIKILTFSVNFQASGNIEKKIIQVFLLLVDAIMDSLNTAY